MRKLLPIIYALLIPLGRAETLFVQSGPIGGAGTRDSRLSVSSAAQFDALIQEFNRGTWDTLDLAEGEYWTRGVWAHSGYTTLPRPVTLRGAGMDRTFIRLAPDAVTQTDGKERPDLVVLWLGQKWQNNGGPFVVEHLTVDGNEEAFPTNRFVTGGIVAHANGVTMRGVRVKGLRGSFVPHYEAFSFLVNNFAAGPYNGPDGGNLIIDCVAESNADRQDYLTLFYMGTRSFAGRPLMQSTVERCYAYGTGEFKPVRVAFSPQQAVLFQNCGADNVQYAIYNDTGPVRDVLIRDSRFTRVAYSGMTLILNDPKERLLVDRCTFDFTGPVGIGMTVWDKWTNGSPAMDIEIRDSVMRTSPGTQWFPTSLKAKARDIKMSNNYWPTNAVMIHQHSEVTVTLPGPILRDYNPTTLRADPATPPGWPEVP